MVTILFIMTNKKSPTGNRSEEDLSVHYAWVLLNSFTKLIMNHYIDILSCSHRHWTRNFSYVTCSVNSKYVMICRSLQNISYLENDHPIFAMKPIYRNQWSDNVKLNSISFPKTLIGWSHPWLAWIVCRTNKIQMIYYEFLLFKCPSFWNIELEYRIFIHLTSVLNFHSVMTHRTNLKFR